MRAEAAELAGGGAAEAPRRRIAIVGTAASSRAEAPYADPSWTIWGCSTCLTVGIPGARFDALFELHAHELLGAGLVDTMRGADCQVYMQHPHPGLPRSLAFPLERITAGLAELLGGRRYMTSTMAAMLALALDEGVDELGLWGVDLALDQEYAEQRPCVEWLIGLAQGRGIPVHVPERSALLKASHVYGFEDPPGDGWISEARLMAEVDRLDERRTALLKLQGDALEVSHSIDGALQLAEEIRPAIYNGAASVADVLKLVDEKLLELRALREKSIDECGGLLDQVHATDGAREQTRALLSYLRARRMGRPA